MFPHGSLVGQHVVASNSGCSRRFRARRGMRLKACTRNQRDHDNNPGYDTIQQPLRPCFFNERLRHHNGFLRTHAEFLILLSRSHTTHGMNLSLSVNHEVLRGHAETFTSYASSPFEYEEEVIFFASSYWPKRSVCLFVFSLNASDTSLASPPPPSAYFAPTCSRYFFRERSSCR